MTLSERITDLRTRRVPVHRMEQFDWFRALDEEQRYTVLERVGMCVGDGPITAEAWACAESDINKTPK